MFSVSEYVPPEVQPDYSNEWRTPSHMYDVVNNPDSVYITAQLQLDIKNPVFCDFIDDLMVVGDLFNIQVYKIVKEARYVEVPPQIVKQPGNLQLKVPLRYLKLTSAQELVISYSDGTLAVFKFSAVEIVFDYQIIPSRDHNGQCLTWYENTEIEQKIVNNICGNEQYIVFCVERTVYIYENKKPVVMRKYNSNIQFADSFTYNDELNIVISTEEGTYIFNCVLYLQNHDNYFDTKIENSPVIRSLSQQKLLPFLLAFGSADGKVLIYDLRTSTFFQTFPISSAVVYVGFSPSHCGILLTASADFQIFIYRIGHKFQRVFNLGFDKTEGIECQLNGIKTPDLNTTYLLKAYFDNFNLFSILHLDSRGMLTSRCLSGTRPTFEFLNSIATSQSRQTDNQVLQDINACVYRRDLSSALSTIFLEMKSLINQKKIRDAEEILKLFDDCKTYINSVQSPQLQQQYLEELYQNQEELQIILFDVMYAGIPLLMNSRLCNFPQAQEVQQYFMFEHVIKLYDMVERQTTNNRDFQNAMDYVEQCSSNAYLLEALMDAAIYFDEKPFEVPVVAKKCLMNGHKNPQFIRAMLPSVFNCYTNEIFTLDAVFPLLKQMLTRQAVSHSHLQSSFGKGSSPQQLRETGDIMQRSSVGFMKYLLEEPEKSKRYVEFMIDFRYRIVQEQGVDIQELQQFFEKFYGFQPLDVRTLIVLINMYVQSSNFDAAKDLIVATYNNINHCYSGVNVSVFNPPLSEFDNDLCPMPVCRLLGAIVRCYFWPRFLSFCLDRIDEPELIQVDIDTIIKYISGTPFLTQNIPKIPYNSINDEYLYEPTQQFATLLTRYQKCINIKLMFPDGTDMEASGNQMTVQYQQFQQKRMETIFAISGSLATCDGICRKFGLEGFAAISDLYK